MDIAIDTNFKPADVFRPTMLASSRPPPPMPLPMSLVPTPPVAPPEVERRTLWWPLALVGFFAVLCATVAFLKSPAARHPSIAPYANAVLAKIG